MKRFFKAKKLFLLAFQALLSVSLSAQNRKVDYYGVFSPDADRNMLKMTEDLFFTQLSEMDISLSDRRENGEASYRNPREIDFQGSSNDSVSFYVEIKREGNALSKWSCTIFIRDNSTSNVSSFQKEYDSYYKILMEAKGSLKNIFALLVDQTGNRNGKSEVSRIPDARNENKSENPSKNISETKESLSSEKPSSESDESIFGTWSGEEFVDKIIIMKGGRGFIIMKNGASMKVGIETETDRDGGKTFIVKQQSHPNASYFPEIPRNVAVEAASTASPVEYRLRLVGGNTLEGTKKTLVMNGGDGEAKAGDIPVSWKKAN